MINSYIIYIIQILVKKLKRLFSVGKLIWALTSPPPFTSNKNIVYQATSKKHLDIIFDNRLSFEEHLRLVVSKINRTLGLLRKLQCLIPRSTLLTIYKTFIRPQFDYGDTIYDTIRWFRKLCYFYKFYKHGSPQYLFKLVPLRHPLTTLEILKTYPSSKQNITFSKIRFFPRLLWSGKVLAITFDMPEALVVLKNQYLEIYQTSPH